MGNKKHISDELLAAYLDGNTNPSETLEVLNAIKADPELRNILNVALSVDDSNSPFVEGVLPMMKLAAESGNNVCSVMCEAFVLHRRSIPFDEKDLLYLS